MPARQRRWPGDLNGPLNSIRWEIQRESIEDYEYLRLLVVATSAAKRRLGSPAEWTDEMRRAKESCHTVVPSISDITKDAPLIVETRKAIVDEIVAMDREP